MYRKTLLIGCLAVLGGILLAFGSNAPMPADSISNHADAGEAVSAFAAGNSFPASANAAGDPLSGEVLPAKSDEPAADTQAEAAPARTEDSLDSAPGAGGEITEETEVEQIRERLIEAQYDAAMDGGAYQPAIGLSQALAQVEQTEAELALLAQIRSRVETQVFSGDFCSGGTLLPVMVDGVAWTLDEIRDAYNAAREAHQQALADLEWARLANGPDS